MAEKNPPRPFTIETVMEELDLPHASAKQVLRRLRAWGYIRLIAFEPSESGLGRRRHVYELTAQAKKYAEHQATKR